MAKRLVYILTIVCITRTLSAHNSLIENISITKNTIKVTVDEEFKKKYLKKNFFVTYDKDIDLDHFDYSVLSMPFIMNIISIVWISGEDYEVDEMDSELYASLKRVKKVFQTMYPKTRWDGELVPKKLIKHSLPFEADAAQTALLFSGGVDSVASALNHKDKKQLLITAWGHWDLPLGNHDIWHTRSKKISEFARCFANESTKIRSNYTSMLNYQYLSSLTPEIPKWRLGAVEGLGWAGLTAPILLSKGYATLHIASSHSWQYPYPSAASPFIDNNLRYCGLKVIHDQFNLSRLQKIKLIGETYDSLEQEKPFLKVCSVEKNYDENCLECRKCLTTVLCFDALGYDPQPFGLYCSKKIHTKIRSIFDQKKLNFYTIQLGKEIQSTIQQRIDRGEEVSRSLKKFLEISFDNKRAFDTSHQTRLDWPTMIDLLPEDHRLEIPKIYQPPTCPAKEQHETVRPSSMPTTGRGAYKATSSYKKGGRYKKQNRHNYRFGF